MDATAPPLEPLPRFCNRAGLSRYHVETLIAEGRLEAVHIGSRTFIPAGALERFVERETAQCRAAIQVPASSGSKGADAGSSNGSREAASASAQLARQTAKRLRCSSRSSSAAAPV